MVGRVAWVSGVECPLGWGVVLWLWRALLVVVAMIGMLLRGVIPVSLTVLVVVWADGQSSVPAVVLSVCCMLALAVGWLVLGWVADCTGQVPRCGGMQLFVVVAVTRQAAGGWRLGSSVDGGGRRVGGLPLVWCRPRRGGGARRWGMTAAARAFPRCAIGVLGISCSVNRSG